MPYTPTFSPAARFKRSASWRTGPACWAASSRCWSCRSKVYGDADPSLTYQVSGLKNGDTAGAGENVGVYGINQGDLALNSGNYDLSYHSGNYDLSYQGNNLTITKALLNVIADRIGIAVDLGLGVGDHIQQCLGDGQVPGHAPQKRRIAPLALFALPHDSHR